MNASNAKDYLPLVRALAEGKEIEWMNVNDKWQVLLEYSFESDPSKYRIKPEPREHWSNRYADGYETPAYFISKSQAENAAYSKNVKQVRYREVIE